jgi:ketosteroid isomerase-like protein
VAGETRRHEDPRRRPRLVAVPANAGTMGRAWGWVPGAQLAPRGGKRVVADRPGESLDELRRPAQSPGLGNTPSATLRARVELAGESIDLGDQVITATPKVGRARTTGIKVRDPYSFLFKIAGRKIVLGREFHDNAEVGPVIPASDNEALAVGEVGRRYVAHLKRMGRKLSTVTAVKSKLRVHLAPYFGERAIGSVSAPSDR